MSVQVANLDAVLCAGNNYDSTAIDLMIVSTFSLYLYLGLQIPIFRYFNSKYPSTILIVFCLSDVLRLSSQTISHRLL